jgi:hypothetical protein
LVPEVLEIFKNTLLYITVCSFGNEGGRGKFLYPPMVQWERVFLSDDYDAL